MTINTEPIYVAVLLESGESGGNRRTWLHLPATKKQFAGALDRIQAKDGDYFIADYTYRIPGMCRHEMKSAPLAVVNHLAARLSILNSEEITKLCAIWDTDHYFDTVRRLIDYTYATDSYTLLPGVSDEESLGAYYIDNPRKFAADATLKNSISRREFGKDLAEIENGVFSPFGYITSKIGWDLPEEDRRVPEHLNLRGWLNEDLYGNWEADYIV